MGEKSKIEWTESSWNPVTGCGKISAGCKFCYAERITERRYGKGSFGNILLHPNRLELPLHWKKARMIFVNSMSDLFHQVVSHSFVDEVFGTIAASLKRGHIYQILTKRATRMHSYMTAVDIGERIGRKLAKRLSGVEPSHMPSRLCPRWPLPNVWIGVSCEDQENYQRRIGCLMQTPATVRFLSLEPLLGEIDLEFEHLFHGRTERIHWVIVGGESGRQARPMNLDWARSIRNQCKEANVAFFMKQLSQADGGHFKDFNSFPKDLQIREWPNREAL